MRIERVSNQQFTIFLTFDDLVERGFTKDELWYDSSHVQSLFSDMMYEASHELGFELEGELLVQVHLMQAQGMHITVTHKNENTSWDEDFVEMKVTLDESKELIFSFIDFEDVIQVSSNLSIKYISGGQLFYMDERYYFLLQRNELNDNNKEDIIAIMSEFSTPSIVTSHRLMEYGKLIIDQNAVAKIMKEFH